MRDRSSSHGWGEPLRRGNIDIQLLGAQAPIIFAGEELASYLPRLLPGAELEVYVGFPDRALAAAGFRHESPLPDETILVRGDGHRYVVAGASPAAVLHAAYALLEALGARWMKPGPEGEAVQPIDTPPPPLHILSTPAFSRRGLADGCLSWWPASASFQDWLGEMKEIVDWMGKMRLNRLFVHFNRLPAGDLSPLLPELERRCIALEIGGHCLPKLLPHGLREAEPSLCRLYDGVRRPDGNFCTANPRTLQLLAEGASRFAERLPLADLYHLWPYDAREEPWCSCPDCRSIPAGQQMWRAVLAAVVGLRAVHPDAEVSGLLYHESRGAANSAPAGMRLLFAPRERCYLHPIDGECLRNRGYLAELQDALRQRVDDISVLEYYGDIILFGRPANRPLMVGADLAAYRSAGVGSILSLVFGKLSWWLYPLQLYGFARGSWDPAGVVASIEEYSRAVGGEAGWDSLARYYKLAEIGAGGHLRFCGYGEDGSWATLPFPPAYPSREAREHLADLRIGQDRLVAAGRLLELIANSGNGHMREITLAHQFEAAFHRAVVMELARLAGNWEGDPRKAFARALEAADEAPSGSLGVFGQHWMLPWLRRCVEMGCKAPM